MTENKIIVDEDWKAQVQAEKEAAEKEAAEKEAAEKGAAHAPHSPPDDKGDSGESASVGGEGALPPATLSLLIMSLTTQAWMMLGQIPDPSTGKGQVHLPYARHTIDMLEMLDQKTHGNRTPEEIAILSRTLHELRMGYVAMEREISRETAKQPR